ncbi:MAG TPA: hypothetical protein VFF73_18535 [Planctomycetota bacterium]|nr:hypothetical protein [Planctomycetota bacterium]
MKRALVLSLVLVSMALAQDDLATTLAKKHAALGKKLKQQGSWQEMRRELVLALELDRDCKDARIALGYKKEGDEWKGAPGPLKPDRAEPGPTLKNEIGTLHAEAAQKLVTAALDAKKAGKTDEARALAGLALDEDDDDAKARDLLDHVKLGKTWTSPHERATRKVFADAAEAAKKEEPPITHGDEALEKLLDLGPLERRESEHAVFLATKKAAADLPALARTIDTIRHAWVALVPKPEKPEPPSDPAAPVASAAKTKARWIVVAPSEHQKFVEKAVTEKTRQPLAKQLKSFSGWTEVSGEKLFLYECSLDPENRGEWAALTAVKTLIQQILPRKASPPGFLVEGLARSFAGRVTGRIDISFVSAKQSLSVHERSSLSFEQMRSFERTVLGLSLEGDFRKLVSKSLNDMEDVDSELALATVEFLLEKKTSETAKFLGALSPDEAPSVTLERILGTSLDQAERELRAWAREEY